MTGNKLLLIQEKEMTCAGVALVSSGKNTHPQGRFFLISEALSPHEPYNHLSVKSLTLLSREDFSDKITLKRTP